MLHADARSAGLVLRLGLIRGINVMFSPDDSAISEEISFELATTKSPEGEVTGKYYHLAAFQSEEYGKFSGQIAYVVSISEALAAGLIIHRTPLGSY
eukprot:4904036-Heterocapsa_arctica.AAC.1